MSDELLARECAVFTRHIVGAAPSDYVIEKYRQAHRARPEKFAPRKGFGAFSVRLASMGTFAARMADAHCRLFTPRGVLRRKLVLLLAILETAPPFHAELDVVRGSRAGQIALLTLSLAGWGAAVLLGSIVLLPARLIHGAEQI